MSNELEDIGAIRGSPLLKLLGDTTKPIQVRIFDDFPGCGGRLKGVPLALRSTSSDEQERAASDALKHLTDAPPAGCGFLREDLYTELAQAIYQHEIKIQLLARAMVDPDDNRKPFARDAAELRRILEPDEVAALHDRLLDYQEERSPLQKLKPEEMEGYLDELGKGQAATNSLLRFDSTSLRSMLIYMAGERRRLMTQLYSATSDTNYAGDRSSSDSSDSDPETAN